MRDMSGVFAVHWKMRLFVVLALIAASEGELVEASYTNCIPQSLYYYGSYNNMSVIFAVFALRHYSPVHIMIEGKWLRYNNIYPSYDDTQI